MMTQFACSVIPSRILAIVLLSSLPAMAAPPDLTAGGTPTTTKSLNLGPTGAHGWLYHVNENSGESRQILVQTVAAGSPAAGILAAGDVILGADGTGANPLNFSSDARKALGLAIADAEARNPATLKLLRWRSGVTTTETITLQTMGAYSATAPYNCPKSAMILEQGIDYVMANQDSGNMKIGLLALLAANNPADPDNAARLARAQTDALSLMPTQAQINDMLAGKVSTESKIAWAVGHKLVVLSEYYLATGDAQVLPGIEAFAVAVANGQSALGTMGHQFTSPGPDGSVNGTYNVGYGCVNSAGMPAFLGLLLAKECGINHPEIEPAIARASRFFAAYTDYSAHPYGEHEPYRQVHESNGKSGLAAICFSLQENRTEEGKFYAKMATAATSERGIGHTGPWFNYLWSPLGAAIGGEAAAASHFSRISWDLDLSRRWDGGFEFNNLYGQGGDGGTPGWQNNFYMFTPALLTYALPLRQLVITGKNPDPNRWLDTNEVADAAFADEYDASARTTQQLVADLGRFSPKVQYYAAKQLGLRTAEHATLVPQLIAIANDANAGEQRVGACFALGEIKTGSAAVHLATLLTDADGEVRFAAAEALRYLPQADRLAQVNTIMAAAASTAKPFYPIDEEDPIHFAHHRLCMLLFYSGSAYGPKGVIWGSGINGIDRNLLYPAIEAVAANPNGQARSTLDQTYRNLTQADVDAVAGAIVDSVKVRAPADKMFSGGVRTGGLSTLQSYNIAEGVPLCRILAEDKTLGGERNHALDVLTLYAGDSTLVNPDPKIAEFCEFLVFTAPTLAADAQQVLNAIVADLNPVAPTAFKSIQSVSVENPTLTLPAKHTRLHVTATDHAQGDTVYTWRKVHGAGQVTFVPNSTGAANNTTIVFDGIPGQYLFEVTMSDSRGLTEAVETVAVTLYQNGGGLPPNSPPAANTQNLTIPQSTTTPILLTGSDPEGYALNYAVTSEPSHGKLSGTAPYLTYTSDFGYIGADSFTFEVMDSEGQTATATINLTIDSIAGLQTAVYEPFDYAAGLLNGKSGTSEVGLTGTWAANTSSAYITAGSLTYGSLSTLGGKFEPTGASNHWGGTRSISSSALAANGLLNDGATLWFSAVVGYGPTANLTNARLSVALANSGFNTANFDYWIKNEGAQFGSGVGITLGRHDGINGRVKATQFRDLASGDGFAGNIDGTWEGNGAAYGLSQHGLIVCRITWAEDPEQPDTIEVFQPLTNLELPGAPISVLNAVLDQSTFDTLTFSRGDYVRLDEIRFGPNYHSVLVGNQPLTADVSAPVPDPVGFHSAPTAVNGTSITMQAATAYDPSGVEYYFTCTAGGGNDSGWQSSTTYTDSGLTPGVPYSYTVKARDLSPARNETTPSAAASATLPTAFSVPDVTGMDQATAEAVIVTYSFAVGTVGTAYSPTVSEGNVISQSPAGETSAAVGSAVNLVVSLGPDPDSNPPTPNPMTFAIAPHATGTTSIAMTATTASDPAGVEYHFTCTSGGGNDSGWQDSPDYEDTGLAPGTTYSYAVTARDKSSSRNETSASAPASATTDEIPGPGADIIPITSFDPATFFSGGIMAGIDFDVDSSGDPGFQAATQAGFLSVPAGASGGDYNVTHNGITFDINTANNTLGSAARWRANAQAGDLINDFEQFYGRSTTTGNGVTAVVTLSGLVPNSDYEVSFFTYNVGAGQTTHSFHHGTSTSDPLITTFTTSGNQTNYSTWVPGITFAINSGASGTITVTIYAPEYANSTNWDSRLTLNGISVVDPNAPANSAPAWTADPVGEIDATEDAAYSGTLADDADDADAGDTLTFAKVSGPAWLNIATDGTLSGTPANADVGSNVFTVSVTDNNSPAVEATLNITVLNTNDAPVFTADPIMGSDATEDAAYSGALAGSATDEDGNNLVYAKVSGPAWLSVAPDGTLSGTPGNADVGTNAFTVSVTDTIAAPVNAALHITVINTNDAPVWAGNPISGANATEDEGYSGTLAASASDGDAGASLSFAKVGGPAWLSVAVNGALSGTPANSDVGSNSFTVSVDDGIAAPVTTTLHITVTNTNDAPVWTNNPLSGAAASEGVAYTGQTLAGQATDADQGDTISYSKVSGPAWLAVAANGTLSGTPPSGSAGLNSFVVRATDTGSTTADATLEITVAGLPLPWVSTDIGTGMLEGSATYDAGTFTQAGSGVIGGTSDTFRFTYQTLTGDGEIIARISALQNTGNSSRVGVMIRESLAANSKQIFAGMTGSNAYRWSRRTITGGKTSNSNYGTGTVPNTWVRLVRTGNTFTTYKSTNGTSWTNMGSTTLPFASTCYIGLAVGSGSNTTLNTSQFGNVSVTP
jgi:hypothetical protein